MLISENLKEKEIESKIQQRAGVHSGPVVVGLSRILTVE